jgi:SAM-dependent methyltransferase
MAEFSSDDYWETRYRMGGHAGAGSSGRLARFKAETINHFIAANRIGSVIDIGCGDASQLELLEVPADYVGVDVSPSAVARCARLFPNRRFIAPDTLRTLPPAELTLSLDVLYHLTDDRGFAAMTQALFAWATRFVAIYASNRDEAGPSPHIRHRRFTAWLAATEPDWRLLAHLPNPHPYDPAFPDTTSFADFFIYGRRNAPCSIVVPAAD